LRFPAAAQGANFLAHGRISDVMAHGCSPYAIARNDVSGWGLDYDPVTRVSIPKGNLNLRWVSHAATEHHAELVAERGFGVLVRSLSRVEIPYSQTPQGVCQMLIGEDATDARSNRLRGFARAVEVDVF
jgi:hypothetical protein